MSSGFLSFGPVDDPAGLDDVDLPRGRIDVEFPEKFGKQEPSGSLGVVNAGSPNEIDFDLTD